MILSHITLENWKSWKELNLSVSPVNIVIGENGSGKTGIIEAIVFGLYGVLPNGQNMGDMIGLWDSKAKVSLLFQDQAGTVKITRTIDQKRSYLSISRGGKVIGLRSMKELQRFIDINITGFEWTEFQSVFYKDSKTKEFLELTDSKKQEFLNLIFRADWDAILKVAKEERKSIEREYTLSEGKIKEIEREKTSLIEKKKRIRSDTVPDGVDIGALNYRKQRILKEIEDVNKKISEVSGKIEFIEERISYLKKVMKDGRCWVCGSSADPKELGKAVESLYRQKKSLISTQDVYREDLNQLYSDLKGVEDHISKVHSANVSEALLDKLIGDTEKREKKLRGEFFKTKTRYHIAESVEALFDKQSDLRAYFTSKCIEILNSSFTQAKDQAGLLWDVKLTFDGKIDCIFSVGGKDYSYYQLSRGERKRLDTVFWYGMVSVLRDVWRRNLIFLFDEVFDGLDRDGLIGVLTLIESAVDKNDRIFITSVDDIVAEGFNIIKVQKEKGVSQIVY